MGWLDRGLARISPKFAYKRMQYRRAFEALDRAQPRGRRPGMLLKRFYEAAARGRRTAGWRAGSGDPNDELRGALETLRNRSRDLVRNNGWACRAVSIWSAKTIGTGLQPTLPTGLSRSVEDDLLDRWDEWAGTTACDVEGRHTFAGLQTLVQREVVEAGEALVRMVFADDADLPVRLQLQVLEPDHLDTHKELSQSNGDRIVHGVQFSRQGRRVGYWLFEDHPGARTISRARRFGRSRFVPAREILHVYRTDRIGQVRGIPWGSPVLLTLKDFGRYVDARLLREEIAACFVGFTHTGEPPVAEPTVGDTAVDSDAIMEFRPGTFEDLPVGREITFSNPPQVQGFDEYTTVTLRQIAMGFGIPYEVLSGDLRRVNFSSGKMGRIDFQSMLDQNRELYLCPQLCAPTWRRFVETLQISGGGRGAPMRVAWTPPERDMIDPPKEVPAVIRRIRSGQMTLSEFLRSRGIANVRRYLEQRQRDDQMLTELGLVLDSDPRATAPAGGGGVGGARDHLEGLLHRIHGSNGVVPASLEGETGGS